MTPDAVAVTVTVADSHAGAAEDVARRLGAAGLEVTQVLPALGLVTGSVAEGRIAALEAVPGVAAVERQATVRLPPPDADVQ